MPSIEQIDALLPQTQCGLCGYGGCRPYATAIVEQNAAINRCPPGGITVLQQLAALTQQDAAPHLKEMQAAQKPFAAARIREAECIGCTKCIQACPVDAIIGSAKQLHTVLRSECTGCELCVAPCPVDCIEIELLPAKTYNPATARKRYYAKLDRQKQREKTAAIPPAASNKKAEILAAVARAKAKRNSL